jgi:hypothetical protein
MQILVGISGNATVGKDTFCRHLITKLAEMGISGVRLAFADSLKDYLNERLPELGINFHKLDPATKELARPIMVYTAEFLRKNSQGSFFVDRLRERIAKLKPTIQVVCIPDLRFCEYPDRDELFFVQKNGITIFLERNGIHPANALERRNNDDLKNKANYVFNLGPSDQTEYHNQITTAAQAIRAKLDERH